MGSSCGKGPTSDAASDPLPPPPVKSAMKNKSLTDTDRERDSAITDEEITREASALKLQALTQGQQERNSKLLNLAPPKMSNRRKSKSIMTQLAIRKFPYIRRAFNLIHDEWNKLGCVGKDKTITRDILGDALKAICKKRFYGGRSN